MILHLTDLLNNRSYWVGVVSEGDTFSTDLSWGMPFHTLVKQYAEGVSILRKAGFYVDSTQTIRICKGESAPEIPQPLSRF